MSGGQHTMVLTGTDAQQREAWRCPTCGRMVMITWDEDFTREVIIRGDDQAQHVGGKGGMDMTAPTVQVT